MPSFLFLSLLAPSAQAGDFGHLSIEFSAGLSPDMAQLGSTIAIDGTVDTAESTMANLLYSTPKVFMGDQSNASIWHNSEDTFSTFKLMGSEPVLGGALLGRELGGRLRYEFDGPIDFPLFLQAGYFSTRKIAGGHQERQFGDVAQRNASLAVLLVLNGEDPADYINGVMITDYDASWTEVPVSIGLQLRHPTRPNTSAYGSVGVSYFSGGFSVAFDADEAYANVLATHVDIDAMSVTNLSPGAVSDKIEFNMNGIGLNYGLGVQAGAGKYLAFFCEMNASGAAKTVFGTELKQESKQLLTALSSSSLASDDPEWFDSMAYPVLTTGATVRLGMRAYFF